ncbi:MAG: chromosome segregation protein SMC [Fimbriimonadaceae bacterium]
MARLPGLHPPAMRLKRVKLFGFKTFADRTEFDIESELTAVVGSNGCGKSNLVDAILWGLGEASPRHLRAASGVDVIFNGSAHRKPLGFAEVTLLFDNEDGSLPLDAAEVSVTRRLTRSGEGEYRINKTVCRQRDVYEMFADSGLGRTGYAIVGQKEIDAALSASPEDRRSWLDEAAGVQRYRARKVEAQRRLTSARNHLERITDILRELELQREPLRDEAEVAQRYKTALNSLRQVETGLLVQELRKAVGEIHVATERGNAAAKLLADETRRADELDGELREVADALERAEAEIEACRAAQHESMTTHERATGDLRLAEQRLTSLDEIEATLGAEVELDQARLAEAREELARAMTEADTDESAYVALRRAGAGSDEAAAKLTGELRTLERELAEAKRIEGQRMKLLAEDAHRADRARSARRELKGIVESERDTAAAVVEAERDETDAAATAERLRSKVVEVQAALSAWQLREDESAVGVRHALAERAGLTGRIQGIESTLAAHEGLAQGARAVLDAVKRGELSGDFLPVGEAITVDERLTVAIETALGAAVNDLIADSELSAKAAVAWLRENRAGRATFQPIPMVRPRDPGPEFKRLLNAPGVVGCAADVVACAAPYRPVIESLLNRVVVAEGIDDALRLSREAGRPYRCVVTIDGELIHAGGAVTGGAASKQGYGLVQRKSDLAKLQRQLAKVEAVLAKAESEAGRRLGDREAETARLAQALTQLKEADVAADDARRFAASLREESQAAARAKARLEREIAGLEAESQIELLPAVDAAAIEARRHELLKKLAARSADAEGMEVRLREAEQRRDSARARAQATDRRLQNMLSADAQRARRLENLGPERLKLRADASRLTLEVERAFKARGAADASVQARQQQKRDLMDRSIELADSARIARETLQTLSDSSHQAELQRTRAEGRRIAAVERLLEEYGTGEAEALRSPEVQLPPDAAALVGRLRRDLRAMGDVNIGAIEAYDRLTARFDELDVQQTDILRGISDVEGSIAELDGLTRGKFVETYEQVQVHFASMVHRLFGGGEGIIELTDPGAILDSGIDIVVTLPGKKRQQLGLLSGGERSLCALAFLFALLEVKCSPLVVLDEVDAPLDGVNIERFATLLKDYAKRTQFIVITHNRETIAAAPMWLGVTMQEPGVSTLVPYREMRHEPAGELAAVI